MFRVSKDWLKQYSTKDRGWNRNQLIALGISWPPFKGWAESLVGLEITDGQRRSFEFHCGKSIQLLDISRKLKAAIDYPVYYTVPDGQGSFTGRCLKPEEVGTWPEK